MKITKLSPLSGYNTLDIDVDPQTYQNYIDKYGWQSYIYPSTDSKDHVVVGVR